MFTLVFLLFHLKVRNKTLQIKLMGCSFGEASHLANNICLAIPFFSVFGVYASEFLGKVLILSALQYTHKSCAAPLFVNIAKTMFLRLNYDLHIWGVSKVWTQGFSLLSVSSLFVQFNYLAYLYLAVHIYCVHLQRIVQLKKCTVVRHEKPNSQLSFLPCLKALKTIL